jgi:ABC-type Fe2+-enterobactin transport system substrate-binding protein
MGTATVETMPRRIVKTRPVTVTVASSLLRRLSPKITAPVMAAARQTTALTRARPKLASSERWSL